MSGVTRYFVLGAAAWLAACAESTGPPQPQTKALGPLHQLRWQATEGPRTFATVGNRVTRAPALGAATNVAVLDNYQTNFWAFPDRDQAIQVNYLAPDGTWQPYLWFSVPNGGLAQWPDGQPVAPGDSVLISVSIDTTSLLVRFEPTGLVFSPLAPAQLAIWYTGANPDFDASGALDGADGYIEQNLLGVWVQEFATDPWQLVAAIQSIPNKLFAAELGHFSDYAVSW